MGETMIRSSVPSAVSANTERGASTIQRVKSMVTGLERRFEEIASMADVINQVAKHTKLLSFNATIEATRAGESGRGFSVVATEVRTLAERTASATADINRILPSVKREITEAVHDVEREEAGALMQAAISLAGLEAARIEAWFQRIATLLDALRHTLGGLRRTSKPLSRSVFDAVMTEFLENNPSLLGIFCGMEPDAFDGRDAEYANTPGTDATGRYISYWHREGGRVVLEPLLGYDIPGQNAYYDLPRRAGTAVMLEPYDYPVGGQVVKVTSLVFPLVWDGRFVGVLGADFLLDELQAGLADRKPFGTGSLMLLSHAGVYATHPDSARIGHEATDLPLNARQAVTQGQSYRFTDAAGIVRILHPLRLGAADQPWSLMLEFDMHRALNGMGMQA
ncbi:hypothetical protein APE01nite_09230 [Acetobacter peroxydans]|uniref:Methyl-accepting transducer domain-containing protein n=1 Tax=Acetobacter peroxydans TaxID=104098 RepID=A0A4Y3TRX1_9PROT|nr:hypothetical protein AA13755_2113 [Acetobacter peroxydans NBRC 13755]GBR40796.1 hypothetical protein AA0475_0795 [Acetobacter peroxydans]GEB85126.1 hypothetical protein APE01nite_09230 [Acetobacter peroxydans]